MQQRTAGSTVKRAILIATRHDFCTIEAENMATPQQEQPATDESDMQIRALQREIVHLKAELDSCRAAASAPSGDGSAESGGENLISLRPLSLDDHLRSKWKLGYGLPHVSKLSAQDIMAQSEMAVSRREGKLRLYGLLSNSFPWEAVIPLKDIVDKQGIYLGRDETLCGIVIPDAGISRRHALLSLENGHLYISDAGSTNGIAINGDPVPGNVLHASFSDGDTISLGETVLRAELMQDVAGA